MDGGNQINGGGVAYENEQIAKAAYTSVPWYHRCSRYLTHFSLTSHSCRTWSRTDVAGQALLRHICRETTKRQTNELKTNLKTGKSSTS